MEIVLLSSCLIAASIDFGIFLHLDGKKGPKKQENLFPDQDWFPSARGRMCCLDVFLRPGDGCHDYAHGRRLRNRKKTAPRRQNPAQR